MLEQHEQLGTAPKSTQETRRSSTNTPQTVVSGSIEAWDVNTRNPACDDSVNRRLDHSHGGHTVGIATGG